MAFALLKLGFWMVLVFGITGLVVFKALRAMKAGQPYRFSFLDGGLLLAGKETRPQVALVAVGGYVLVIGGILAWPLGVYEWVGERNSGCLELVTPDEVQRIGDPAFGDLYVHELDTLCSMTMTTPDYEQFEVELDSHGGWAGMGGFGIEPSESTEISTPNGGTVLRIDEDRRTTLRFTHGQGGGTVTLPSAHFDDADVTEIAALIDERRAVVQPYVDSAAPAGDGERFFRRNLPYLFLALVALLFAGGIGFTVMRRNRAMKRVLEEDP